MKKEKENTKEVIDVEDEISEQRLAKWRTYPSMKVSERVDRAQSQRMFLISRDDISNTLKTFNVLGSVGNVYTVTITHQPDCTCPDFQKGNLCKHILFVYLKVLQVDSKSPLIYQSALLTSELKDIFADAPLSPGSIMASTQVQKKFREMNGMETKEEERKEEKKEEVTTGVKRRPVDGDCPICYEAMSETENLVWCQSACGNNMHTECFKQWQTAKKSKDEVTCVYCRTPWKLPETKSTKTNESSTASNVEGYVNFAQFQPGMSSVRPYYETWNSRRYGYY